MRDPNRINVICEKLAELWALVPDWRLGQLFNNLQRAERSDLFYMEDDKLIDRLRAMLTE